MWDGEYLWRHSIPYVQIEPRKTCIFSFFSPRSGWCIRSLVVCFSFFFFRVFFVSGGAELSLPYFLHKDCQHPYTTKQKKTIQLRKWSRCQYINTLIFILFIVNNSTEIGLVDCSPLNSNTVWSLIILWNNLLEQAGGGGEEKYRAARFCQVFSRVNVVGAEDMHVRRHVQWKGFVAAILFHVQAKRLWCLLLGYSYSRGQATSNMGPQSSVTFLFCQNRVAPYGYGACDSLKIFCSQSHPLHKNKRASCKRREAQSRKRTSK